MTTATDADGVQAAPSPQGASAPMTQRIETLLGALVMAMLVVLTLGNVLVRYFSDQSFAWTEEISVFLLVALTLIGTATAAAHDRHIRIDYLYDGGGKARRRLLRVMSGVLTVAAFALLAALMLRAGLAEHQFGETTMGTGVPRWWYTAGLTPLAAWVAFRALQALLAGPGHAEGDLR